MTEDPEKVVIAADLPGVAQQSVEIQVGKDVLTPSVDAEKITASIKDGVLTLTLPKRAEALPRQIKINVQS